MNITLIKHQVTKSTASVMPKRSQGFTLLEVLIAIAIFSVISMASFSIFETVLNSDTSTKARTDRINELQRGFLIIERDMLQIARRSVRLNGEAPQNGFLHTDTEKIVERVHFNFVDAVLGEEPKVRPLISEVESLNFEFYDGKKWQKSLKENTLPMAIAIELDTTDYGIIRRQFIVAGDNLDGEDESRG